MRDSSSNTNGSNKPETITDAETGVVYHVLRRDIKAGVETLVVAGAELTLESTTCDKRTRYAFDNSYVGKVFTGFLMDQSLTRTELAVLGFLIQNMSAGCKIQVSQTVIAESLAMDRARISKALKALKEKMIIIEDVNPLAPNVPLYLIDPEVAYKGYRESYDFSRKKYGKKLREQSEARKPQ